MHNRIAVNLSHMHPEWNDDWVFQETKKIVIAIHQNIVYAEWLDLLLGPNDFHVHSYQEGYEDVYDLKGGIKAWSIAFQTKKKDAFCKRHLKRYVLSKFSKDLY